MSNSDHWKIALVSSQNPPDNSRQTPPQGNARFAVGSSSPPFIFCEPYLWRKRPTEETPDGRFVVKIDFLKEKESFNLELIQGNSNLPEILSVRALEGVCRNVPMGTQQIIPMWFNYSVLFLLVVGTYQTLVWIFKLLQV